MECVFTSSARTECGMFVMCCMSVSAVFVVRGCVCLEEVYRCLQL